MTPRERMEACERFLKELQSTIPSSERVMAGYASEATVQTDATGKKLNGGWWPVPWSEGKYINANSNAYACISSSIKTPNPANGKERFWRGEASFGHGLALMVDDIGNGKGSKGGFTLRDFYSVLKPTAVVETSPDNYQLWYFLDEPEPSLLRFKSFIVSFVTNVLGKGGDNTIRDVSRYGRMPIGYNNKRHSADGPLKYPLAEHGNDAGKPVLVHLRDADYTRRYSIDQICRAFKFEVLTPVKRQIQIDPNEYKFDALWLQMAEKILSRAQMGEGSDGEVAMNMSGKYRIQCPWGHQHGNGDVYGAYFRGPIPGAEVEFVFGCAHDNCRKLHKRGWSQFIDEVVIDHIAEQLEAINARHAR